MNQILLLTIFLLTSYAHVKAQTSTSEQPKSEGGVNVSEELDKDDTRPDFLPRITHKVIANYTDEAFEKAVSGKVVLKAILSAEGKVTKIQVVKGLPDGLTEKAIHAAQKIKFDPALKGGKPMTYRVKIEYSFYCPGLDLKKIKTILRKENPWLSENASILLTNQLYLISGISYYEVIQFTPELIKKGIDFLSSSDRQEYTELLTILKQSLSPTEQAVLQQFPFLSGKEVTAEDRQKSNAVLRKGWDQLSSQQQQRWRELHNQVVEFGLFRRRVLQ
jgi:TonB family protein